MRMTQKDLQLLIDLGAAEELTPEYNPDFWYNVVCRVYGSDGGLRAKLLVGSKNENEEFRGKLFVARGSMANCY